MEAQTTNIFPLKAPIPVPSRPLPERKKSPQPIEFQDSLMFTTLWETSNEGMLLTDEKGTIVLVNPAFCLMTGMKMEELLGQTFVSIYADSEDAENIASEYESRFRAKKKASATEQKFQLKNGRSIEVETYETFIESDDGQTLLLTRFRNITDEKNTQRTLIESELKYRSLFANSVMPMFQSNVNGKLINANRAMLKLLGYDNFYELAELDTNKDIYAYPEECKAITEILNQKGYIVNAEIRLKRKNRRVITVLQSARTLVDEEGKIIGYEGIMEDITARKALEKKIQEYIWALEESKNELAELNAQKDKLFSILSHDLRSPFSSILGFCDILLKENDQLSSEDRTQFISYIQEAAQEQLSLVNKLLDWSRLESGRIRMERVEIDLQEMAKKNITSMMGLAHQKQVDLQTTLPQNVFVYGDRQLMGQVFGNLISNSLKFTPPNGTISIDLIEDRKNEWVIGIRDTGIGIPDEDINKLFKIEEKYTRKGLHGEKGTGLGLPLVYEIIQKHHGNIEVKSKPGQGTTFVITLPKSRPEEGDIILLAGNEHELRILYSRYIKQIMPNANVLHATDENEIMQYALEFQPKVIISSDEIKNSSGLDLLKALKANSLTQNIPVIFLTTGNSDTNRHILIRSGANAVLSKPFTTEQLLEVLDGIEKSPLKSTVMN